MSAKSETCRADACPAIEELVRMMSAEHYRGILDEYSRIIEQYPDYLTYHWMSTSLTLQYHLKRNDIPGLNIGECISGSALGCCFVDALREAITRRSHTSITTNVDGDGSAVRPGLEPECGSDSSLGVLG